LTLAVRLASLNDFDEWRAKARQLLTAGVPPETVVWRGPGEENGLFEGGDDMLPSGDQFVGSVPAGFIELAQAAICNRDPERFALLYRLLWRLLRDRNLLRSRSDADLRRLELMASGVRRDSHKMKAFVRFKSIVDDSGLERFAAWFEPDHYVLERVAPFFVRRFTGMIWAIITPCRSALWDGEDLCFSNGGRKSDVPAEDALEGTWKTYFSSIFNPARLKVAMMKSEMPVKYWRNLPEAELIPSLIQDASRREQEMIARAPSTPSVRHERQARRTAVPDTPDAARIVSLADARAAVQDCKRCPLYELATQAVFGEGPAAADVMFVGEQPGDQEDLAGKPFVGPAGQLFDRALETAGIDRRRTYVTNAVKHFKFVPRGKRRLHQKPDSGEVAACRFWLDLEREFVKPRLIVALGATAVDSILGRTATIASLRGEPLQLDDGTTLFVTIHPSYLLRLRDEDDRRRESAAFAADLARLAAMMMALDASAPTAG
jgi:probable DNA metabolism protein